MVSYAPYFISTVVICGMIAIFMDADTGIFNQIIVALGGESVDFLSNPRYFKSIYVWSGVWQGMGYSSIIYISALAGVDSSLHEAAIMDGCTYFGVFFRVLLPLLKPAIVTVMILKGVGVYNEYYMANLYLQNKNWYVTVATSLFKFTGPLGNQYNYICAGVILTMIPALLVFILCQKQIYSGLTQGSVKG